MGLVRVEEIADVKSIRTRPSIIGFLPRYLSAFLPPILVFLLMYITDYYSIEAPSPVYIAVLFLLFAVAWVRWWRETFWSLILLPFITGYVMYSNGLGLGDLTPDLLLKLSLTSSVIVGFYVELFRRSIQYIVEPAGITLRGGVFVKRMRTINIAEIKEVVVKKFPIIDVGHVVILTGTGLSTQEDTHGAGAGTGIRKLFGFMFASRTRTSETSDPLNMMYGVRHPGKIHDVLREYLGIELSMMATQVKLLREIRDATREERG